MLDLLLTVDDLPAGWRQQREARYHVGLLYDEDCDKRARRAKLVGATRIFVNPETSGQLIVQGMPWATEADARSVLTAPRSRRLRSWDLNAQTTEEIEVAAPPQAGAEARATLISTTSRTGAVRKLIVLWPEPGALLVGIVHSAPAEVELYELMSALIERQRERIATRESLVTD